MPHSPLSLFNTYKFSFGACLILSLFSCNQKNNKVDASIKQQFQQIDSLFIAGKSESALKRLPKLRGQIKTNNVLITDYYCFEAQQYTNNPEKEKLYADSALAFFNSESRKNDYPDQYLKCLITKADACLHTGKYITALNYYYKAKKMIPAANCDNGLLAAKMGSIYFSQKNFVLSAKYLAESYNRLESCDDGLKPEQRFFAKQASLDNAGVAYQKAGMPDSAMIYYNMDLNLINKADSDNILSKHAVNTAKAVVYDNIGGLYLSQGSLRAAEDYLTQCLAIPLPVVDGMTIPPNLKLAELYLKAGQLNKAQDAFKRAKILLDQYGKQDPQLVIKWNKLYAEYLYKTGKPAEAFGYLSHSVVQTDSLERLSSDFYHLDVERELNTLEQQNELAELAQKNGIKKTYIIGSAVIALLSIFIIILINRSLKRSKKNHRNATLQNKQMQLTLDELERVNQNYIRIMRVMAHDLRNPLSGMTGLAAMMMDDDDFSEENKHMLKLIETTGTHSMEMINELLKSGLADENEKIVTQKLDLCTLLFDSVELLQFKADEKSQKLIFEGGDQSIMANVNHEKIWRVFNNLIVNAIKFSHPNSTITIGIRSNGKNILISVADKGIGIAEADKNNIFEMFTPAKRMGTAGEQPFGLGLSISKKLIEKHNGHIWFKSEPGQGTTFYVELPTI